MSSQATIELINRMMGLVEHNGQELAEAVATRRASEYMDRDRFQREVSTFFRQHPIVVGHVSQVMKPGDFFTHSETGIPILVVRDQARTIRAFVNVCRHRGAIVESEREGVGKKAFRCPYHAWVYDLTGRLAGVPERDAFPNCSAETSSLVPLEVGECNGLILVRPSVTGGVAVDALLGPLRSAFVGVTLDEYSLVRRDEFVVNANWKIIMDGGLETYHFSTVHGASFGLLYAHRQACFDKFGPHSRLALPKKDILKSKETDPVTWKLADKAVVNYLIFPNTLLILAIDHFILFSVFPVDVNRTIVHNAIYGPAPISPEQKQRLLRGADFSKQVVQEDFVIGDSVQAGLAAGVNSTYTFGRLEPALAHFHSGIDAALASSAPEQVQITRPNSDT